MGLKTLLVCLTTTEHADTLMNVAVPLARKHNAHLIGLHTVEALIVYPGIAMHIPEPTYAAFNESQRKASAEIKEIFTKHTFNEDFQSEFRLVLADSVSAADRMVESARAADLVIMAHPDKQADRFDQRKAHAQVIRESGRPVIVVPLNYEGPEIGKKILLGWSDTREAARAAHDLLSIAGDQAELTVLRVTPASIDELRDGEGIEIAEMFSRHGLKPTMERRQPGSTGIAEILNQVAFEEGADLIATGAFGHSRTYDFVIGATTYELLKDAKLPVMFSK